ncbi:hypothetical protein N665_0367s0019 [Sinapis alba]|nr:hypothetical protein N665_0367s0019 [Sinapis alba]
MQYVSLNQNTRDTGHISLWESPFKVLRLDRWVVFEKINGFKLNGGGTFDSEGNAAWKANNCHKTFECKKLLISVRFDFVDNAEIKICEGLKILNTKITTGDDCISVGDGMKNLLIEKVVCGPGHGISVGSLGRYRWEQDVNDIKVINCTLDGTDNGLRIKTWPSAACTTTAAGIHFEDIILNNKPSTIKLVDISFRNIRGTSGNKDAVKLLCSKGLPCENVEIGDINIEYKGADGPPTFECTNVTPKLVGTQNPKACVGPVVKAPGQE